MQLHFRNGTAPCRRTDHADADLKRLSPASAFCFIFCGNFRKDSHRRDRRFRCFCSSRVRSESLKVRNMSLCHCIGSLGRGSRRSGSQPDSVSWFLFSFKQNVFRTAFRPKEVCADSVIQFIFNSYRKLGNIIRNSRSETAAARSRFAPRRFLK